MAEVQLRNEKYWICREFFALVTSCCLFASKEESLEK